jgi:RimJ/RimL family protein N-acetyltransferase
MLDAYRGTIDYHGETLEDAIDEIHAYLAGNRGGEPMLTVSRLALVGSLAVGACLVCRWDMRQWPLIAYVMTREEWKRRGVGQQALISTLQALREHGYDRVCAVITEGNVPSESLFHRVGFAEVLADHTASSN